MPTLSHHQSNALVKLLLLGDSKCLDGDCVVKVTRGRSIGKAMTIRELHQRMQGAHYAFDPDLATYLLCDTGGYAGLGRMGNIVYSGVKYVHTVTAGDNKIMATADHKFLTDEGWKLLSQITVGSWVKHWTPGSSGPAPAKPRVTIYSIPHHPLAMANWVNGKNYKRSSQARLTVEAAMNDIDLEEFIEVLRGAPDIAAGLNYLPTNLDVHHKNGDTMDDSIGNLEVLSRVEHFAEENRGALTKPITNIKVNHISESIKRHTFDISMIDEGHNFIANGFVVHNSGKTGSLVSLVTAGYHLRILDLDNLLDILRYMILQQCPDRLDNVEFRSLRDKTKAGPTGTVLDGKPTAWIDAIKMLAQWKYDDTDLGIPGAWGPNTILVIDSLSRLCDAAYNFHETIIPKGRSGDYDGRAVYGNAQDDVEKLLGMLTSPSFATNLIVIAHGTYMENADGTRKVFPQGIGQKLSPKIPQYFPNYVRYRNSMGKRTIQLTSDATIDLGNTNPNVLKDPLPIETGLATFFKALRDAPQEAPTIEATPKPKTLTLMRRP